MPGIGEIIGEARERMTLKAVPKRMDELGLRKESYDTILIFVNMVPTRHSGFGLDLNVA